jgi:hypothetical protein
MFAAMHPGGCLAAPAIGKHGAREKSRRAVAVLAILLAAAGCDRDRRSGGVPDDHGEHSGHVIPAHKPGTFPDAVRRLKTLDEAIGRGAANRSAGRAVGDETLSMATDIAGWLPEIAAESDMPEGPWGEVNRLSAALVAEYWALRKVSGDRADAALASGRIVAALGVILEEADPRWFDKPVGTPSGPP